MTLPYPGRSGTSDLPSDYDPGFRQTQRDGPRRLQRPDPWESDLGRLPQTKPLCRDGGPWEPKREPSARQAVFLLKMTFMAVAPVEITGLS